MAVNVAMLQELWLFNSLSEDQLGKVAELCEEKSISAL
jgi:hypothetical protein